MNTNHWPRYGDVALLNGASIGPQRLKKHKHNNRAVATSSRRREFLCPFAAHS
jgi:hypothetical protein